MYKSCIERRLRCSILHVASFRNMEVNTKGTIEAILFAAGNPVEIKDLQLILEKSKDEIEEIINQMNMEIIYDKKGSKTISEPF